MKHLLSLSLFFAAAGLTGQSFEWDKPSAATTHPKEVQVAQDTEADPTDGLAGIYAPDADGTTTAYGEIYRANELTGSHPALPLGTLLRVTNMENGRSVVVRITDRGRECAECVVTVSNRAARQLGMDDKSQVSIQRDGFSNWNPAPGETTQTQSAPVRPTLASNLIAPKPAPTAPASTENDPERPSVFTREVITSPAPAPAIARAPQGEPSTYEASVAPPPPTVAPERQARGVEETPAQESYTIQLGAYTNEVYAVRRVEELKEQGLQNAYFRAVTKSNGEVINRVFSGTYANANDAQTAVREIADKYNLSGIVTKK